MQKFMVLESLRARAFCPIKLTLHEQHCTLLLPSVMQDLQDHLQGYWNVSVQGKGLVSVHLAVLHLQGGTLACDKPIVSMQ